MEDIKTLVVVVNNSQFINIKNFIDARYNNDESKLYLYGYIKQAVQSIAYSLEDFLSETNVGSLVNISNYTEYIETVDDSEIGENDFIIDTTDIEMVIEFFDDYTIHGHKLQYEFIENKNKNKNTTVDNNKDDISSLSQHELIKLIDKSLDESDFEKVKYYSQYLKESSVLSFKYFLYIKENIKYGK